MYAPQPTGASGVKSIISHILAHGSKSPGASAGYDESTEAEHKHMNQGAETKSGTQGYETLCVFVCCQLAIEEQLRNSFVRDVAR